MFPFRPALRPAATVISLLLPSSCKVPLGSRLVSAAAALVSNQSRPLLTSSCDEPSRLHANQVLHISKRYLAKSKDRVKNDKGGSGKPKVILTDDEMEKLIQFDELKVEVETIIDDMKNDLKLNFNARINPRQIESLQIPYDGIMVALADIVTISRKQQDLVLNMSATPTATKPAMQAILDSGLNLNPQQDGNVIYIRIPKVTTEHRDRLIKSVKALGQKTKDTIKNSSFHKKFNVPGVDPKKLSKDLVHDIGENLNYYIKQKQIQIDEIIATKCASLDTN